MTSPMKDFISLVKGTNRSIIVGLLILAMIIGFALGDFAGQSRHKSTVDEAMATVLKRDTQAPNKKILERAAIEAILKSTGDRWSNYIPLSTIDIFSAQIQGRYSGVGLWLRRTESGLLEVSNVDPGSPASLAGIKVRDLLISVDGTDVTTAPVSTAIAALRGTAKSTVTLKLERDQNSYSVNVKRAKVLNGDVLASQIAPRSRTRSSARRASRGSMSTACSHGMMARAAERGRAGYCAVPYRRSAARPIRIKKTPGR